MESEDELEFGVEDSELDSDEEATTEIALNVDEKYLHSLLHSSPIADFSPPFSPPILPCSIQQQEKYHQLANNNTEDESFWLPPPMAMISKGKTLPPPAAEGEILKDEKMFFGYSPSPQTNVLLVADGRMSPHPPHQPPPTMAPPIARDGKEEDEMEGKDASASSSHLPTTTTSSATSSHQQKSSSGAAATPSSSHSQPLTNNPNQQPNSSSSSQSSPQVVVRQRPAIPPKPQKLDIVRFSMAQARDECDLDTILSELLELENQLSGEYGDQMVLGWPALKSAGQKATGAIQSEMMASTQPQQSICAAPIEQMAKRVQFQQFANQNQTDSSALLARLPPSTNGGNDFGCISPDADSAFGDSSSTESAHPPIHHNHQLANNDTNFGGNVAQNGRNVGGGERGSEFSSADSFRGSLNTTPSPTNHQQTNGLLVGQIGSQGHCQNGGGMPPPPGNRPPSSADSFVSTVSKDEQKKAKIREALEKMKEAKMKKVFVKIFLEDGSQRGLLLDERWTVAETMRQLVDKIGCLLTAEHAIVEEYPHLHIKRAFEDHEFVVENLEDWTADSPNKLHFVRFPQKWTLFRHPQLFLLTDRNRAEFPDQKSQWDRAEKAKLLEEYLQGDSSTSRVPELEGWLMLKADGKKSWRKHFFVLRASGLYYVAKPGKSRGPTRDLNCLMSVFNNQVYICTDWRKKYKAPSDWGFAIKHPRIQVKTSKYIKYICAEDETTFLQWITALRIIKNGCPILHKNFCAISTQSSYHLPPHHHSSTSTLASSSGGGGCPGTPAIRVQVPQVPLQRLSALDPSTFNLLGQSPRHQQQKVLFAQQNSGGGCNSPAMTRASFAAISNSSRCNGGESSNSSRLDSPIHVSFAFDQDQCNTIKRQPDSLAANGIQQQQFPPPSASIRHHFDANYGGRLGTPTTSNRNTSNNSTILLENGAESDSDEEQFPPPPPNERPPTNSATGGAAIFAHAESTRRMLATNGVAPQCPPKPSALQLANNSPWKTASNSSPMATVEFAATPPPPPKRADGTRIQTIGGSGIDDCGLNGGPTRNVQMLMAELQLATNKQKMRLEQNL